MEINDRIKNYMLGHKEELSRGDESQALCFDGIVDEAVYREQPLRVCFLLKETNLTDQTKKKDWDYVDWLNYNQLHGKRERSGEEKQDSEHLYKTYHNACMWIAELYGILRREDVRYADYTYSQTDDGALDLNRLRAELAKVAFVNLKKTWGGASTRWKDLDAYINDRVGRRRTVCEGVRAALQYEMSLIRPRLVICGGQGVYDFARSIFGVDREIGGLTEAEAFERDGMIFLKFRHPACRGRRTEQFEYAKRIFGEVLPTVKDRP